MAKFFCPACYGGKVYCRRCKSSHCGCTWNTKAKCDAEAKVKKPPSSLDIESRHE